MVWNQITGFGVYGFCIRNDLVMELITILRLRVSGFSWVSCLCRSSSLSLDNIRRKKNITDAFVSGDWRGDTESYYLLCIGNTLQEHVLIVRWNLTFKRSTFNGKICIRIFCTSMEFEDGSDCYSLYTLRFHRKSHQN